MCGLLLLTTGILVPGNHTAFEELSGIQGKFHCISEIQNYKVYLAESSEINSNTRPTLLTDYPVPDFLYYLNNSSKLQGKRVSCFWQSRLPSAEKHRLFSKVSGLVKIAHDLFSSFFDLLAVHDTYLNLFSGHDAVLYESDQDFYDYTLQQFLYVGTMASSSASLGAGGGIPLHEFRKDVPPGWCPGLPDYPLRLYFERLKLWYQIYDGEDTMVGPLVAGRLQGKAQRLGLTLRLPRPDGGVDIGGEALARLTVEEVRDPSDPTVILQQHVPSGVQALCNALKDAFGVSDQELVSRSIEEFFEYRRGKPSFQEYAIEWDCKLEEATTRAGLQINDVAKFYLFFRNSGLPAKFIEDIKLQLQGDLRRFQDARSLALRLISRKDDIGTSEGNFYERDEYDELYEWYADDYDDEWDSPWESWYEDGWLVMDYENYAADYEEDWSYYDGMIDEAPAAEQAAQTDDEQTNQSEDHSPSYSSDPTAESFPVHKGKGKGKGKPTGCTICGSRWHHASACPVGADGGGKDNKGYPHGGKGKPYGSGGYGKKGKSRGKKGKGGKGKWTPKGKGYGYRGGRGYHRSGSGGYFGYTGAKTLHNDFDSTRSFSTPPRKPTVHFKLDHDDAERILPLNRSKVHAEDKSSTEAADDAPRGTPLPEKKLAFNFTSSIYNTETYHTILGAKRRGLLVDPGAASGLIGSETLRDLLEHCSSATAVRWNKSKTTNVSGISGGADSTLGEIEIPLDISGAEATFKADVLGGEGSLCPALLSNPALRRQRAAILSNWFANGDGALGVQTETGDLHVLRLLLTDSGHYLLPTDEKRSMPADDQKDVRLKLACWTREIADRWDDLRPEVRHCFLQHPQISTQERERYSDNQEKQKAKTNVTSSLPTTSTTSGSAAKSGILLSEQNVGSDVVIETNVTSSSRTTSTTSGSCILDSTTLSPQSTERSTTLSPQSTERSTTLSPQSTEQDKSFSVKPFLDNPAPIAKEDFWEHDLIHNKLIRHHRIPRRILFTPNATRDCPVPRDLLTSERSTQIRSWNQRRHIVRFLEDDWQGVAAPNRDLGQLWTGRTVFHIKAETTSTSTPDVEASLPQHFLDNGDFPPYSGDVFPDHWNETCIKKAQNYYKALPEEFYSRTGRRPITPKNAKTWMQNVLARNQPLRFQFWEWFSGSGRLSLILLLANLSVGFSGGSQIWMGPRL